MTDLGSGIPTRGPIVGTDRRPTRPGRHRLMPLGHRRRRWLAQLLLVLSLLLAFAGAAFPIGETAHATPGVVTVGAVAGSPRFIVQAAREDTARETLARAETAWDLLAPRFTHHPAEPVVIVVVEDEAEYERIQPAPMTRGFATFGGRHIYLLGDQLDQEVVTHELVHILLGVNVRPGLWIPDWFNEGLAQWASGSRPRSLELLYTASADRFLPLDELDRVDALVGPDRQMATLEGAAVVRFLADVYGEQAVWDLTRNLSTAESFNRALFDTFGYTNLELSSQWLAYADDAYDLLSPAGLSVLASLAFACLIILAVAAWSVRRALRSSAMALEPALTSEEIQEARRAERELLAPADHPPPWRHDGPSTL